LRIETKLEEIGEWIEKRKEEEQRVERISDKEEGARGLSSVGSGNEREYISVRSEGGISIGSSLSAKEVERIRKWVTDKDRKDRRKNIVIKEIRMPKEVGNDRRKGTEWAKDLIRKISYICECNGLQRK